MKKVILTVVFIMLMCFRVSAEESALLPGDSVYASAEKQEQIAAGISEDIHNMLKRNQCVVLKESITPIYYIDPMECLENENITVHPGDYPSLEAYVEMTQTKLDNWIYGEKIKECEVEPILKSPEEETNIYVCRAIDYRGIPTAYYNLLICLDDFGNIKIETTWDSMLNVPAFADDKLTIESILQEIGIDSVSEQDLRYVRICGILTSDDECFDYGGAYYYTNGEKEVLIPVRTYKLLFGEKKYLVDDEILERFRFLKEKREDEIAFAEKYKSEKRNGYEYDFELDYKTNLLEDTRIEGDVFVLNIREYLDHGIYINSIPDQSRLIGELGEYTEYKNPDLIATEPESTEGELESATTEAEKR